jgi:hypothetical protein
MMDPILNARCFLCCEPLVADADRKHFIPHCFYEGRRLPNEPNLTLPAHHECNASTSIDEQWVATILALARLDEELFLEVFAQTPKPKAAAGARKR